MRGIVAAPLRIAIVTPAGRGSRAGNRVTALRWAGLLRQLGHRPRLHTAWQQQPCDLLVTVHAVKSAPVVLAARRERPDLPIVTLLSGTDIYPWIDLDAQTDAALHAADALLCLQPRALEALPEALRARAHALLQSATALPAPRDESFSMCMLSHLRPVKGALEAIRAVAALPAATQATLTIAGEELDERYSAQVHAAIEATPRVAWAGALSRRASKLLLARSAVCLVPSLAEGGPNGISEAHAAGTPGLCRDAPGNLGVLGDDWPGTFAVADVEAMAAAIQAAATDIEFLDGLRAATAALQPMVAPAREREGWRQLLERLRAR